MLSELSQLVDSVGDSDKKVWSSFCCQIGNKSMDDREVLCRNISARSRLLIPMLPYLITLKGYNRVLGLMGI